MTERYVRPDPAHNAKVGGNQTFGQYRVSVTTGILAATLAAGANVFNFYYKAPALAAGNRAALQAVISRIRARFLPMTPFTAGTADVGSFDAFVFRGAGGAPTTQLVTLTTNNGKLQTNMATTNAVMSISATAALATTGLPTTPTYDANAFASAERGYFGNVAAGTAELPSPTDLDLTFYPNIQQFESPLILGNNEGFSILNRTIWPAAGTGALNVEISWSEVSAY
jgi:hypothetical protein